MNKKLRFFGILAVLVVVAGFNFTAFAKVELTGTLTKEVLAYKYWNTNLSYEERVADLLSHMTLSEKITELLSHGQPAIERLGVAKYWWPGEACKGIGNISLWYGATVSDPVSTVFPSLMGQGATWNPDLIQEMASMIGDEARAYYNESLKGLSHWAPTINMARDPRWGRIDESYSEDPFLTTQMGAAFVNGFQNDSSSDYLKAIATIKHFAANSTEADRFYSTSDMDERDLREFYVRHFEQIIKDTNVEGIMPAYNAVNGTPCCANEFLLTDLARDTWGYKGFFISDLSAVINLYKYTQANTTGSNYWTSYTCSSLAQAVSDPMKAGLNLELYANGIYGMTAVWMNNAQTAVDEGLITEDDIDKALFNMYLARFKTGEFDRDSTDFSDIKTVEYYVYTDTTHRDEAREVAEQGTVLLENNGILPLNASNISSLVVVGAYADTVYYGPYTSSQTTTKQTIETSPYDAIAAKYLAANSEGSVTLIEPTLDSTTSTYTLTDDQLTTIGNADAVIVYLHTTNSDFGEGKDRTSLDFSSGQADMAAQIAAANANTVVYMHAGGPMAVESFKDDVAALLWCCYNGQEQGPACANLLFGDTNPSGRLTTTWYTDVTQLGDNYSNYGVRPLTEQAGYGKTYMYFTGDVTYPFGYGLSYSTFSIGSVSLDKTVNVTGDDTLTATTSVTNSSSVDGYEVVQLYVVSPSGGSERPAKRLAGFSKVWVAAGETVTVTIPIKVSLLSYWDATNECFDFDLGTYTVQVGTDSDSISSTATFALIKGQTLAVGVVTPTPSGYLLTAKGDQITTTLSVAMNNDKLYSNVTGTSLNVTGASRTYSDGSTLRIRYSSSNSRVARVNSSGVVTAVGEGVATITAKVIMDGVTYTGSYPVAVNYGD